MGTTQFDYRMLRGKIREKFGTQSAFASAMKLSGVSVSKKLNNAIDWKQEEIEKAMQQLDLPYNEIHTYFFSSKVEKN